MELVKWIIYKDFQGTHAWEVIEVDDPRFDGWIPKSSRPAAVNSRGGYHSISNYKNNPAFVEFRECPKGEDPLKIEEIAPKNKEFFNYGWISPDGDTYTVKWHAHDEIAEELCKTLGYNEDSDKQLILERYGWIRVTTSDLTNERVAYHAFELPTNEQLRVIEKHKLKLKHIFDKGY